MDNAKTLSREGIKDLAKEVVEFLRPQKLQAWQAKEVLRYAIEHVDQQILE